MFYKFLINYIRLIMFKKILNSVLSKTAKGQVKGKNLKTMNFLTYALEFAATYLLDKKKKGK